MLGLSGHQLLNEIDHGCFGMGGLALNIPGQPVLNPDDILRKLASGVAKAIEANNRAIEQQLRSQGRI